MAHRDISILKRIDAICVEPVFIGGHQDGCISSDSYQRLLRKFPTSTEVNHYAGARVAACIREDIDTARDLEETYNQYMNRKVVATGSKLLSIFAAAELAKYQTILKRLRHMLASEHDYSEKQWQQEILSIIQLLHPKYIRVFENVRIRDTVNSTHRYLDLMLVDAGGHIDLIEIKKPFERRILSRGEYRGNFVPTRELSGSIMQLEKYILYLNKWGSAGEKALSERYASQLPAGLTLKIVNPTGLVVFGRETGMKRRQREDFEVVKRKYRSVADIMTYDDLIARLESVIAQFSSLSQADP